MTKRMLIDATHSEETRVVVADNQKLLDYEYESAMRKQLRGSIFLAKVTRVEPSLQAAFVNYGGNRHGFLPFSEIHPDYYRIPIADREALLEEQRKTLEEARLAEEEEDAEFEKMEKGKAPSTKKKAPKSKKEDDPENIESLDDETKDEEPEELGGGADADLDDEDDDASEDDNDDESDDTSDSDDDNGDDTNGNKKNGNHRFSRGKGRGRYRGKHNNNKGRRSNHRSDRVEMVGGDSIDGDRPIRPNLTRRYKIQEVIKRGQIMLVQVSKEERGAKGAAVTSYLSLPGRYCVLMPNSPRSGGVSRKIANYKDRKRLREILKEFNVPEGMSVIVRTAGVARTKTEIKRDLDYLLRLWDNIRSTTLESQAPAMIYEEGELVQRAIRDIYDRDMNEIIVEGARGYKIAKDIMKMMIPSHAKRVKEYKDHKRSLYQAHGLEQQISGIGEPSVPLKSGGSLVIHPTEALVSIDVNSGRATKERHIEETALRTNLEAAEEVARQLRLRDLGGLVVIDFIDMEDRRNNGKVERKLKDALSADRARLQVGRISSFGLLELSRQRIGASVTETQFQRCDHCEGTGFIRTVDSMAILVLRSLETMALEGQAAQVAVTVTGDVALYILNQKRHKLTDIESRYDVKIFIHADRDATPTFHSIEVLKTRKELEKESADNEESDSGEKQDEEKSSDKDQQNNKGRGRNNNNNHNRNQKGRGRGRNNNQQQDDQKNQNQNQNESSSSDKNNQQDDDKVQKPKRGRKPKNAQKDDVKDNTKDDKKPEVDSKDEKPKRGRRPKKSETDASVDEKKAQDSQAETLKPEEDKKPKPRGRAKKKVEDAVIEQAPASNDDQPKDVKSDGAEPTQKETLEQKHAREAEVVNAAPAKKKKGWWSKVLD